MTLELGLGSAVTLGTVVVAVVAWLFRQNDRINKKADTSALAAAHEEGRQHCAICRREVDAEIARRSGEVAEQRESIAVLRAEMAGLTRRIDERFDSMREDIRSLAAQIERLLTRGQP